GIHADRVDPGQVGSAAEPLGSRRMPPQAFAELPGRAAVVAAEEAAGDGPAPQPSGLVRSTDGEAPHPLEAPHEGLAVRGGLVFPVGLLGIGRYADLGPGGAAVLAALDLDPEVAEVLEGVPSPVPGIGAGEAEVVAQEVP